MILKRVRVQNFRAIRDATVEFGLHTAILGGNGAGKSTILRAIERFYAPSSAVESDDFFGRKFDDPITITLTFTGFNEDEVNRFGDRIRGDELTVSRVFEAGGGRSNGRYFGTTRQYAPFAEIRASDTGAREKRAAFALLAPELGLAPAANAEELAARMAQWEADNPEACEDRVDDGAFFGFSNVARGNLQKSTSFVFIPAVRDASADSVDGRGAVVAKLMELVVRSAVQQRADVKGFQQRVSAEYKDLIDPEKLPELNELAGGLSGTLKDFYPDAAVALRWQPVADFSIPLPAADVLLEEDGFQGPVDRKGHGLQRAFIVTLLQHLARAGSADIQAAVAGELGEEAPNQGRYVLPGLILAIEEPELYQHPTKQRHFAKVLRQLSDGSLPGVAAQTQVMFASHSPLFVALDRFDEVRLARRRRLLENQEKECAITRSTLERVAGRLAQAHQAPEGKFTPGSLRPRLHIVGPELAEGFFADMVVLVEGISDRAALLAVASSEGFDFEAYGVAVLWVDGKTKLDKPTIIFQELGIPTFLIFDCDGGKDAKANHALQRLHGCQDCQDAVDRVEDDYASFSGSLETVLREEISVDIFNEVIAATQIALGMEEREEVLKTPAAMSMAIRMAAEKGKVSPTLQAIVAKIRQRRAALS